MKTYSIVGMNWLKTEQFVDRLNLGVDVTLAREPDNPADPRAIAVWIDGRKVGYVPKAQNAALAQYIDQRGQPWTAPMALDSQVTPDLPSPQKAIPAKFARSPNSGYPQVQVSG